MDLKCNQSIYVSYLYMSCCRQELLEQLRDPDRHMIGPGQVDSVREAVQQSVREGQKWQVRRLPTLWDLSYRQT